VERASERLGKLLQDVVVEILDASTGKARAVRAS